MSGKEKATRRQKDGTRVWRGMAEENEKKNTASSKF